MSDLLDRSQTALVTVTLDPPGFAAGIRWESPARTRIQLHSITVTVDTNVLPGNRHLVVYATHGGTVFASSPAPGHQTGDEIIKYYFSPCALGLDESDDLQKMWSPLTSGLYLDLNHAIIIELLETELTDEITAATIRYFQKLPR